MSQDVQITILGCGHSAGTPAAGNIWGGCDPSHPRNRRTRASVYVHGEQGAFVIDTGLDFRNQINSNNINQIDAVIYTHCHADHVNGIDDLRNWCKYQGKIDFPVYMDTKTWGVMSQRFDYLLEREPDPFYPILFQPKILKESDLYRPIEMAGIKMTLFEQDHKTCTSLGVRIGNVGYSTDMRDLSETSIETLKGIDIWIVDAAAYKGEPGVHANIKTVCLLNQKIGARQVYLTHMPPTMDYETLKSELPPGFEPAYDGLVLMARI